MEPGPAMEYGSSMVSDPKMECDLAMATELTLVHNAVAMGGPVLLR
jgi:hypothetical protein